MLGWGGTKPLTAGTRLTAPALAGADTPTGPPGVTPPAPCTGVRLARVWGCCRQEGARRGACAGRQGLAQQRHELTPVQTPRAAGPEHTRLQAHTCAHTHTHACAHAWSCSRTGALLPIPNLRQPAASRACTGLTSSTVVGMGLPSWHPAGRATLSPWGRGWWGVAAPSFTPVQAQAVSAPDTGSGQQGRCIHHQGTSAAPGGSGRRHSLGRGLRAGSAGHRLPMTQSIHHRATQLGRAQAGLRLPGGRGLSPPPPHSTHRWGEPTRNTAWVPPAL